MAQIPAPLFNQLLPRAADWAEKQEQVILTHGESRALTAEEQEIACQAGVQRFEAVRILAVPEIPFPEEADLRAAAQVVGLITRGIAGLTLGHGISVRRDLVSRQDLPLLSAQESHASAAENAATAATNERVGIARLLGPLAAAHQHSQ